MKMNKKGFTLIELLAVIVILAVIALIAAPIILGIIADSRESSNLRSIENYGNAIVTQTSTLQTTHPDIDAFTICVGATMGSSCHVDASIAARDSSTGTTATLPAPYDTETAKTVTYSGTGVNCTTGTYDPINASTELKGCVIGAAKTKYGWDSKKGAIACTKVDGTTAINASDSRCS